MRESCLLLTALNLKSALAQTLRHPVRGWHSSRLLPYLPAPLRPAFLPEKLISEFPSTLTSCQVQESSHCHLDSDDSEAKTGRAAEMEAWSLRL